MQTESHHQLSGSASSPLEIPQSAQYLLNKGAKHGRIETKKRSHLELLQHMFLLDGGVGKPLHGVTHLSLMPQGPHCILTALQACQDQLHKQ